VRGLGEVVAGVARPDEDVVGEVLGELVRVLLGRGEDAAEEGDVLEGPGVAVGEGGAVADAGDLRGEGRSKRGSGGGGEVCGRARE
jgi:hypothetical protein